MSSRSFLLFGLLLVTLMIISQGGAETSESHAEAKGVEDAKYGGGGYPGGGYQGGGGYPGGGYQGGGGYPGGGYQGGGGRHGGGGGGYCRYGCCGRRDYRGYCLRCCGLEAQVEAKPHN